MSPEQRGALESFQRTHRNHLGKLLRVDGELGPETQWSLDFATLCQARRSIIIAAQGFIGLEEVPPGSNTDPGENITSWLSRCGAKPHDPWCAAFASWCLSQGVARAIRQGNAQALGKLFPETDSPMAGDLFWYPTSAEHGHVGIVSGVGANEVMTLEGNCANATRCARRPRLSQGVARLRFAQTVINTAGTSPGVVPSVLPPPTGTR